MFVAMRNNLDGKGDDPKYYRPEEKKESEKLEAKPFNVRIKDVGLTTLANSWRKDYSQIVGAETPEFIEQVENVLTGISNGYFGTSTPEGMKEIDEAFRAAMKEVPF